jgi:hypothetical protein
MEKANPKQHFLVDDKIMPSLSLVGAFLPPPTTKIGGGARMAFGIRHIIIAYISINVSLPPSSHSLQPPQLLISPSTFGMMRNVKMQMVEWERQTAHCAIKMGKQKKNCVFIRTKSWHE